MTTQRPTSPVERRAASRIQRVAAAGGALYFKEHTTDDWENDDETILARAEREANTIVRLGDLRMLGRRLGVLRLVEKTAAQPTLITAEVPGRSLHAILRNYSQSRDGRGCLRAMLLAGRWLREFQTMPVYPGDLTRIGGKTPENLVEYCELRLRSLHSLGFHGLSSDTAGRITRSVGRLVEATSEAEKRKVWSHCDYTFCNLIWDGRTLTPIDFAMARPDVPLLDVTYFIHRLEMQRVYRPWTRWPVGAWRRALLRGYGRTDAVGSPMYQALMIRHLICRLHRYVRCPPRNRKQALHDRYVMWWLRRRLCREAAGE